MGYWGKLLGAGIGWWTLGPIGAIMGLVIGHLSDEQTDLFKEDSGYRTQDRNGFLASLLILIAAVMKADGKVVRSELDFVKRSLVMSFGEKKASEGLLILRDILKQNIPVNDVARQIKLNVNYSSRLQLIHLLYGIANADGSLSVQEQRIISIIAQEIGIASSDFESIKATFGSDVDSCYKVLDIDETVSDAEVKRAYRKMAVKYHPDKVVHLGEDIRKSAEEKFRKLNEAFNTIKKERNMK